MLKNQQENKKLLELADSNVSRETFERLERYARLILKWQRTINLISQGTLDKIWERHFLDSAQILRYLPNKPLKILDFGSGAGFPGLVIAIMRPSSNVCLIESDQRKSSFLRAVIREVNIDNADVFNCRIERLSEENLFSSLPEYIVARALAPLSTLLDYCYPWAVQNKELRMLFLKGQKADEELLEAQKKYKYKAQKHIGILSENQTVGYILEISNLCIK